MTQRNVDPVQHTQIFRRRQKVECFFVFFFGQAKLLSLEISSLLSLRFPLVLVHTQTFVPPSPSTITPMRKTLLLAFHSSVHQPGIDLTHLFLLGLKLNYTSSLHHDFGLPQLFRMWHFLPSVIRVCFNKN